MQIQIDFKGIAKKVSEKETLFKELNFSVTNDDIISIVGPNGSGKSTFLKILAGVTKQTKGDLTIKIDNIEIKHNDFHKYFGYVAPYLNLYEEFLPLEHIKVISKIRNIPFDEKESLQLLDKFDLARHRLKPIRVFSSGMKQRMRFVLSILNNPHILLLDEPFSNLDDKGINSCKDFIDDVKKKNGVIFIASNDEREISLTNKQINLKDYKK